MKIVKNKPTITRKELEGVLDCLINNELVSGGTVKQFETAISQLLQSKYSLSTNSLTSAYHLIYSVLEIEEKSEIIMPSYMDQAALSALQYTQGKAILVDSIENSVFPSIESIKEQINENTAAIILPHTFGYHFHTNGLKDIKVPIIQDLSHSIGTELDDETSAIKPSFTVLSFEPSMILTTGNGGMVLTDNARHFAAMRDLRGGNKKHLNFDSTMTDFQGAMGISQLLQLKAFIKRRQKIAQVYTDALALTSHKALFPYSENFSYQTFPVIFEAPQEKINRYWKKSGVEAVQALSTPLHQLLNLRGLDFPNADRMSKKLFSIPVYPTLTKNEIEKISRALSTFI